MGLSPHKVVSKYLAKIAASRTPMFDTLYREGLKYYGKLDMYARRVTHSADYVEDPNNRDWEKAVAISVKRTEETFNILRPFLSGWEREIEHLKDEMSSEQNPPVAGLMKEAIIALAREGVELEAALKDLNRSYTTATSVKTREEAVEALHRLSIDVSTVKSMFQGQFRGALGKLNKVRETQAMFERVYRG